MHSKLPRSLPSRKRAARRASHTTKPTARRSGVKLPRWVWLLLVAWSLTTALILTAYFGSQFVGTLAFIHAALVGLKERVSLLLELALLILKHWLDH